MRQLSGGSNFVNGVEFPAYVIGLAEFMCALNVDPLEVSKQEILQHAELYNSSFTRPEVLTIEAVQVVNDPEPDTGVSTNHLVDQFLSAAIAIADGEPEQDLKKIYSSIFNRDAVIESYTFPVGSLLFSLRAVLQQQGRTDLVEKIDLILAKYHFSHKQISS